MLKLNERGWGLSIFIVFIVVFVIAIILVSIGAEKAGIGSGNGITSLPTENPGGKNNYTDQEITLAKDYEAVVQNAAFRYFEVTYANQNPSNKIVVSVSTLLSSGYLDSFSVAGNTCSGYTVVSIDGENRLYQPYVHCGDVYTTTGYDYSLES